MVKRRRRLPPKPPDLPPGFMWWHNKLMTIADVEYFSKQIIGNHDNLPRAQRDRANGIVRRFKLSKKKPSP
jgi:hypothetical protein